MKGKHEHRAVVRKTLTFRAADSVSEEGPEAARRLLPAGIGLLLLFLLLEAPLALRAQDSDLIDMYRSARLKEQADHLLTNGWRPRPLFPELLSSPGIDSVRALLQRLSDESEEAGSAEPAFELAGHRAIRRGEQGWFERRFEDTRWAYLGGEELTPIDTMLTRDLRARLEARFGPPTKTLADVAHRRNQLREEYVQFEYWLVVNDTIPVRVMDVNGPFDRGIVFSGDARHRGRLSAIRRALLGPLITEGERAPYVDYYFEREEQVWYRTGFDGDTFFLTRIPWSALVPGRRPRLEDLAR